MVYFKVVLVIGYKKQQSIPFMGAIVISFQPNKGMKGRGNQYEEKNHKFIAYGNHGCNSIYWMR